MAKFYFDFNEYPTGTLPTTGTDWIRSGSGTAVFTTVDDQTVLRLSAANNNNIYAKHTEVTVANVGEIAALLRVTALNSGSGGNFFRVFLRDFERSAERVVANISLSNATANLLYGTATIGSVPIVVPAIGQLYWIRLRLDGRDVSVKLWPHGTDEPGGWLLTATGASTLTGQLPVGVGVYNSTVEFLRVGVGTYGDPAPAEPVAPGPVPEPETITVSAVRVVQSADAVTPGTLRATRSNASAPIATRRANRAAAAIPAATARLARTLVGIAPGTTRTVRVSAMADGTTRRATQAHAEITALTRRAARATATTAVGTRRTVSAQVGETIQAAAARVARATASACGAAGRLIRATAAVAGNTLRHVTALAGATVSAATRRTARVAGSSTAGVTARYTQVTAAARSATRRATLTRATIAGVSREVTQVTDSARGATRRAVISLAGNTILAASARRVSVCNSTVGAARRRVTLIATVSGAARRIVRAASSVVSAAAARRVASRVSTLAVAVRRVFSGPPRPSGSLTVTVQVREGSLRAEPREARLEVINVVLPWFQGNTGTLRATFRDGKRNRADAQNLTITITRLDTGEQVPTDPSLIVRDDVGVYAYDWTPTEPGDYLVQFRGVVDGWPEAVPLRVRIRAPEEAPVVG